MKLVFAFILLTLTVTIAIKEINKSENSTNLNREKRGIPFFLLIDLFSDDEVILDLVEDDINMLSNIKKSIQEQIEEELLKKKSINKIRTKRNAFERITRSKFIYPTIIFFMNKLRKMGENFGVKKEKSIIVRPKPLFRRKRSFGKMMANAFKKAGATTIKTGGSIMKWGGIYVVGSAGSKYIERKMDQSFDQEDNERANWNCHKNNFGCMRGRCWTNCGPRVKTADYCYTTYKIPQNTTEKVKLIKCNYDSQCANCLPCGTTCVYGTDQLIIEGDEN